MRIRDGDKAVVDTSKLLGYCLSAAHTRGRFKAHQFKTRLGLGPDEVDVVKLALTKAVSSSDTAELGDRDAFGQRYVLDLTMRGGKGEATVRSHWIVRNGENYPRLLTCGVVN